MPTGEEILNENYNENKERFREHLIWTKNQIDTCEKAIVKFEDKIKNYKKELIELKKTTIEEWVEKHPLRKG